MTAIDLAPPRGVQTLARGSGSVLGRLLRALQTREDRVHLHALPDHMLRDMGFLRDQIDDVLRGAVRRPD